MRSILLFSTALVLALSPPVCRAQATHAPTDSQKVAGFYRQAILHLQERDLRSAAANFQQLLQIDSTHYDAWLGLGEVHMRIRRYEEARGFLHRAVAQDPDRVEARFQLAQTYLKGGDDLLAAIPTQSSHKQQARQMFEDIIVDHPKHILSRMVLGDLWMIVPPPNAERSLSQYETILAFKPGYRRAREGAAASRLRLGQLEQGAAELAQLLDEEPRNPHLSLLLGTAYHLLGNYEPAVEAYKLSIDALPLPPPLSSNQDQWRRRLQVRQWNLSLAYRAAHGAYPGDLPEKYRIQFALVTEASPVRYTDVGPLYGVDKLDRGRGSAWGDYDLDGDLDLFTTGIHTTHALYRNEAGDGFTDVARDIGLEDHRGGWGASCADYDNDGDLDLYVSRDAWEGGTPNSLYQNQAGAGFVEVSRQAGVEDPDASFTHTWGDYDNDGFLDLYVAEGVTGDGTPNKLFYNQGDGTFEDRAAEAGVDHTGKTLGVAFGDYDNDGDLDLYVSNVGGPNALYRNEADGAFTDITGPAGVSQPDAGSYVTFFFDYDADGDLDLFVSAFAYYNSFVESQVIGYASGPNAPHLYRNDGDDHFIDVAAGTCLSRSVGSMGAGFGDIDYDGFIDLYLSNGGPNFPRLEPNILYRNKAGEGFADITQSAGVGHIGKGHGVSMADYDADGDLDLYAGVGGHYPGDLWHNSLYRNEGHENHYLIVEVEGTATNRSAIGAHVRVRAGDYVQIAEISSGNGFGCTNSLPMEIGLGKRTRVDTVEVRWPSGKIERRIDLDVDQTLRFTEGL